MTKRTSKFRTVAALFALTFIAGCSAAQAQCPGGNCARSVGFYTPWGGAWYNQRPCSNGRCNVPKTPAEPQSPKNEEPEEPLEAELSICGIVSEIVNHHRALYGLPALTVDADLCSGCESHSIWMANGGGFQHSIGIGGRECIAMGVRSPEAVVNMWLNSSGHRAIILGSGRIIGVGVFGGYWTLRVR